MLEGIHRIHVIGIGGAGMRAIAQILVSQGYEVTGSDVHDSAAIERFRQQGVTVYLKQEAKNVANAEVVVRSTAIHDDNPEIVEAKRLGLPILHRSDIVKNVLDMTKGIAVAGAHGKTTTTSMIGQILVEADMDPSVIIGGEVDYLNGSSQWGHGEYSVAEADESDGSFLKLNPYRVLITNIENDHMDHYGTIENLWNAFKEFICKLPKDGVAVVCGDNTALQQIMPDVDRTFITYGSSSANDYWYDDLHYEEGKLHFTVMKGQKNLGQVVLQVPGKHNALNALGAFAMTYELGVPVEAIIGALGKFKGAKRRFETKGHVKGVWVVDDYAHHPTEIAATLRAAKSMGTHRVVCLFQPHRYTRTSLLLKQYQHAFDAADVLMMTDIYAAGEEPIQGITGRSIPDAVEATGKKVIYVADINDAPAKLKELVQSGDLVLTMGAGTVNQYGPKLVSLLEDEK